MMTYDSIVSRKPQKLFSMTTALSATGNDRERSAVNAQAVRLAHKSSSNSHFLLRRQRRLRAEVENVSQHIRYR